MDTSDPNSATDTRREALSWLADYGDEMFAYAAARVRDSSLAEDLVQETFLAALRGYRDFEHRSAVKTWLIGILRRKVADHFRRRSSGPQVDLETEETLTQHSFTARGHWKTRVSRWALEPWEVLDKRDFWSSLDGCLEKLKPPLSEVFLLRVMDRIEVQEICELLGITTANLSVRLHRARMALRECLEKNWFGASRGD